VQRRCPECGADLGGHEKCEQLFHDALAMEWEDPPRSYEAHHLLVGTYMLQHPSGFTPEAEAWYRQAIATVVDEGLSAPELRERTRGKLEQADRAFDIKAKEPRAVVPREWSATIADVLEGPASELPERVWRWARAVREDLREI
jgi:hypothetical protein